MPAFILTAEDAKDAEKYKGLYWTPDSRLLTPDYYLPPKFPFISLICSIVPNTITRIPGVI